MTQQVPVYLDSNQDLSRILSGDTLAPTSLGSGSPDAQSFLNGDGSWNYLTNRGLKTALFGSQHWARDSEEYDVTAGNLSVLSSVVTIALPTSPTATRLPLLTYIHLYPYTAGSNPFDVMYLHGALTTRLGLNTFTFSYPTAPSSYYASTNTYKLVLAKRLNECALFTEMNKVMGNPFRLEWNFSTTFSTTDMLTLTSTMLAQNPDVVIGDFGIRTDIDASVSYATILSNVLAMLQLCVNKRVKVLFEIPVSWPSMNATKVAVLRKLSTAIQRWALYTSSDVKVVDNSIIGAGTDGVGSALMFYADGYTPSQLGNRNRALRLCKIAEQWNLPTVDIGALNSNDYYGASSESNNLYQGGWSATGRSASAVDSAASGTLDNEVNIALAGTATRAAVCSLVQRVDNTAAYDSVFLLSSSSIINPTSIDVTLGEASVAHPMYANAVLGGTYQASLELSTTSLSSLKILKISVEGYITYITSSVYSIFVSSAYDFGNVANEDFADYSGEIILPEFTLPSSLQAVSLDNLYIRVYISYNAIFTATLRIGRAALRRVA
jgi:hypothetical protein